MSVSALPPATERDGRPQLVRERLRLRLVAADTGHTWGDGQLVEGLAIDVLLAVSGRPVAPALLTGPGSGKLAARV